MDGPGVEGKGDETSLYHVPSFHSTGCRDYGWRLLLGIFCGSLAVRGLTALAVSQPGFTDSYYYFHVAGNLLAGRGFVEDFVWNYLEGAPPITHASNSYWGPLASVIILPFFWLLGPSFRAAQLAMVVVSALLPVITYVIARDLRCTHRQAAIAALLTVFSGVYTVYWTVPEGYVPFAVAGSLSLYALSKGIGNSWRWMALSGASAGLAQLARTDGVLLLLIVLAASIVQSKRRAPGRVFWGNLVPAVAACGGYAIVMAPWFARTWMATGSPLSGAGLKTLFLREYNDVFSIGKSIDLNYFLEWGWQGIAWSKSLALVANVHVVAEALSYILLPLAVAGLWSLRKEAQAIPFVIYGAILFAVMTIAFTFPGPLGSLLHSLAALLPFLMTCVAVGLDRAIELYSRHRPHLDPKLTSRLCSGVLVAAQVLLTCGLTFAAVRNWETRYSYTLYPAAGVLLNSRLAANEAVMVIDPPAFFYFNNRPAIVVPNDEPNVLLKTARDYGVRFLILEPAHVRPLDSLYRDQAVHPGFTLWKQLQNEQGQALKIYELDL